MQVTDKIASNQAWAFTATNCTYAPLVKDAKWTFYMAYNGSAVFPADATEFAGAVVNKRYAVWAGGELASGAVINSTRPMARTKKRGRPKTDCPLPSRVV
jgi:hypothetical protein